MVVAAVVVEALVVQKLDDQMAAEMVVVGEICLVVVLETCVAAAVVVEETAKALGQVVDEKHHTESFDQLLWLLQHSHINPFRCMLFDVVLVSKCQLVVLVAEAVVRMAPELWRIYRQ